jgi:hypothetical protein
MPKPVVIHILWVGRHIIYASDIYVHTHSCDIEVGLPNQLAVQHLCRTSHTCTLDSYLPYSNLMIPNNYIIICIRKSPKSDFGVGKWYFGNHKLGYFQIKFVKWKNAHFCNKLLVLGAE